MPITVTIDTTLEIEILTFALECVAQTEPCDLTDAAVSLLAGQVREKTRQIRKGDTRCQS
jgi:hypothetical protein